MGLVGVIVGVGVTDGVKVFDGFGCKQGTKWNSSHPIESITLTIIDSTPLKNGGESITCGTVETPDATK